MVSTQEDLLYFTRAAGELEGYLLSEELYWPLGLGQHMEVSQLTPGNLLLCETRLQNLPSSFEGFHSFLLHQEKIHQIRSQWKSHWLKKITREFSTRLHQWQNNLNESTNIGREYSHIVRDRVILELLQEEHPVILDQDLVLLQKLDELLKSKVVSSQFIWNLELENRFPRTKFWFLYAQPLKSNNTRR